MFNKSKEKFRLAIEKIATSTYNESVGKSQLSKIINRWKLEADNIPIRDAIQEILSCFHGLPGWVSQRFTYVPGYYYEEGGSRKYLPQVVGWTDGEQQIQVEPLPLRLHYQQWSEDRFCEVLDWGSESEGFSAAVELPVVCKIAPQRLEVVVPAEQLQLLLEYGYFPPCQIQWERRDNQRDPDENGYYVTRSIISHGFWCAWKWWPGCRFWYLDKRPELFEDAEWQSLPEHNKPGPGSVVLGGQNREFWERNKFYIED